MRRMNQIPLCASISRSTSVDVCSTVRASASRLRSDASELKSARGRPISPGITLKKSRVAGVKKRRVSARARQGLQVEVEGPRMPRLVHRAARSHLPRVRPGRGLDRGTKSRPQVLWRKGEHIVSRLARWHVQIRGGRAEEIQAFV